MLAILTERLLRRALIVIALGGLIIGLIAWGGWSQRAGMVGLGCGYSTRRYGPAHLDDPRLPGRAHGGRRSRVRLDVGRSCAR